MSDDLLAHLARSVEAIRDDIEKQGRQAARLEAKIAGLDKDLNKILHVVVDDDSRALMPRVIMLENNMDRLWARLGELTDIDTDDVPRVSLERERAKTERAKWVAIAKSAAPIGIAAIALLSQIAQWLIAR